MRWIYQWGLMAVEVVSEFDHRCWSNELNGERDTLRANPGVGGVPICVLYLEGNWPRGRGIFAATDDNNHLSCGRRALRKSHTSAAGSLIMIINIRYSSVSHTNELQREVRKSGFAPPIATPGVPLIINSATTFL